MEGEALDTKSTHNSNAQLSEKYSPLWKCSKRLFHLGLTEWSVLPLTLVVLNTKHFQVSKKQHEQHKKKALQTSTRSKRSHLLHFTNKHSQHGQSSPKCIVTTQTELQINDYLRWWSSVYDLFWRAVLRWNPFVVSWLSNPPFLLELIWEWFTCMHNYFNLKSFCMLSMEPNEAIS